MPTPGAQHQLSSHQGDAASFAWSLGVLVGGSAGLFPAKCPKAKVSEGYHTTPKATHKHPLGKQITSATKQAGEAQNWTKPSLGTQQQGGCWVGTALGMLRGADREGDAAGAYLDVGSLQVAVGHPALKIGSHLLGGSVPGRCSQPRLLAAPQAAGSPQQGPPEGQLASGPRPQLLQPHLPPAAPPAPQPRLPQLPPAAQRPLQAPRRRREVAAVVRLHPAGIQRVEGLQGGAFPPAPPGCLARRLLQQHDQQQGPPRPAPPRSHAGSRVVLPPGSAPCSPARPRPRTALPHLLKGSQPPARPPLPRPGPPPPQRGRWSGRGARRHGPGPRGASPRRRWL